MDFWSTFKGAHLIFNDHLPGMLFHRLYKNAHSQSILMELEGLDCLKLNQLLYIFQYTW